MIVGGQGSWEETKNETKKERKRTATPAKYEPKHIYRDWIENTSNQNTPTIDHGPHLHQPHCILKEDVEDGIHPPFGGEESGGKGDYHRKMDQCPRRDVHLQTNF
jgi:hypothetical protein